MAEVVLVLLGEVESGSESMLVALNDVEFPLVFVELNEVLFDPVSSTSSSLASGLKTKETGVTDDELVDDASLALILAACSALGSSPSPSGISSPASGPSPVLGSVSASSA